jgi:cysteinyl-tRNA synthetase
VMNITDIDDKIIKKSIAEKKKISEITIPYTKAFKEDIKALNIETPEVMPKATAHIKEMVDLIKKLIKRGYAYKGTDGSIYFPIAKYPKYGRLSKIDKSSLMRGARIEADEYNKEEVQDFVLWKAKKDGEPSWKTSLGEGRPGWHIECSAMAMKYLGASFDIHTGAVDNIFPHHENEIAQSEAATGKPFAKYWLHSEHLIVNGEKMAKSLGNFYTLRDIEEKGFNPLAFRYMALQTHYRTKLNFTLESLQAAENGLNNLLTEVKRSSAAAKMTKEKPTVKDDKKEKAYEKAFLNAINDDLNTSQALSIVWETANDQEMHPTKKLEIIQKFDEVLGLGIKKAKNIGLTAEVRKLAKDRDEARKAKDFAKSDEIRNKLQEMGYRVEDSKMGTMVFK